MPAPDPARILRQHLHTDALLGVTAVPTPSPLSKQSPPNPTASAKANAVGSYSASAIVDAVRPPAPTRFTLTPDTPSAAPPLPPLHPAEIKLLTGLSTNEKLNRLQALAAEFENDSKVQATRPPDTSLVFGEGNVDAQLMFIGEGPGETEDRMGRPFVGKAGELLDKMISAMGLAREKVYIANIVKYRPPGNRTPTPEEAAIQGPYLAQQVAIIRPMVLVALGGVAAKFALQTDTGITRLRGQWAQFTHTDPPLPIMPTFHPAYLLRSYTPDNRMKVWSDLQKVMEKIKQES